MVYLDEAEETGSLVVIDSSKDKILEVLLVHFVALLPIMVHISMVDDIVIIVVGRQNR